MLTVRLIEIDDAVAHALRASPRRFESVCGISLGQNPGLVRDAVQQTLAMLSAAPTPAPWVGYLAADEPSEMVVGTCAFKTGPDQDGVIQIAYFTFPSFEGRGVATPWPASFSKWLAHHRKCGRSSLTRCPSATLRRACWRRAACSVSVR